MTVRDRIKVWDARSGNVIHDLKPPSRVRSRFNAFGFQGQDLLVVGDPAAPSVYALDKDRWLEGRARDEALEGFDATSPAYAKNRRIIDGEGGRFSIDTLNGRLHFALFPVNSEELRPEWLIYSDEAEEPVSGSAGARAYAFWRDGEGVWPAQAFPERWR